ncbi:MAG: TolC family protein [Marinobacter sp.]|nr:TolC family protein [Marinobacter sp.]
MYRQGTGFKALLLALVFGASPTVHSATTALTLTEAWYQLQQADDNIAAGQAAQARAAALLSSSTHLLLPQVDLVASYTRLDAPIELDALALNPLNSAADTVPGQLLIDLLGGTDAFRTPVTSRNVTRSSLALFWPLYTGGKISSARDLLALGEQEATVLLEDIHRARFMELIHIYYGLVMAERALATQQQAEDALASHFRSAQALEEQQQIARVERLVAESAYDQARITTRALREQRDSARQALASLVHQNDAHNPVLMPTTSLFTVTALPPQPEFEPGLARHPSLQLLANKQSQAERVASASRGLYHPNLFMFGSYNVYEEDSLASDLSPDWLIGVGVRMPLVDRSGRRGKVRAADSTVTELGHLHQAAERKLTLLLDHQYREARQALLEHRDLASTLALAEQTLHLQERAFAEGLGRAQDVIDAQAFLSTIQTRRDAAAFRFVVSFAQLLSLSGQQEAIFTYLAEGEPVQ